MKFAKACCECGKTLPSKVFISGIGECSHCNTKQRIKISQTRIALVAVLSSIFLLREPFFIELIIALLIGTIFLGFATMEPIQED